MIRLTVYKDGSEPDLHNNGLSLKVPMDIAENYYNIEKAMICEDRYKEIWSLYQSVGSKIWNECKEYHEKNKK